MNCSVLDCGAVVHGDRDAVVGDVAREVRAHHREAGQAESRAAHARHPTHEARQRLVSRLATDRADRHDGAGGLWRCPRQRSIRGETVLVSQSTGGANASGVDVVNLSSNGRCAVFASNDPALPQANGSAQIYLRDTEANTTTLISKGAGDAAGDGESRNPVITPDCRYVAWDSVATNLRDRADPAPRLPPRSEYRHERADQPGRRRGRRDPGLTGAFVPRMSADGNVVAFATRAKNLSSEDTDGNIHTDVFVRIVSTDHTELVSRTFTDAGITRPAGRRLLHVDLRRRALRRVRHRGGERHRRGRELRRRRGRARPRRRHDDARQPGDGRQRRAGRLPLLTPAALGRRLEGRVRDAVPTTSARSRPRTRRRPCIASTSTSATSPPAPRCSPAARTEPAARPATPTPAASPGSRSPTTAPRSCSTRRRRTSAPPPRSGHLPVVPAQPRDEHHPDGGGRRGELVVAGDQRRRDARGVLHRPGLVAGDTDGQLDIYLHRYVPGGGAPPTPTPTPTPDRRAGPAAAASADRRR